MIRLDLDLESEFWLHCGIVIDKRGTKGRELS